MDDSVLSLQLRRITGKQQNYHETHADVLSKKRQLHSKDNKDGSKNLLNPKADFG